MNIKNAFLFSFLMMSAFAGAHDDQTVQANVAQGTEQAASARVENTPIASAKPGIFARAFNSTKDAMNNGVDYVKGCYNKAANSVKEFNINYPYTAVVAEANADQTAQANVAQGTEQAESAPVENTPIASAKPGIFARAFNSTKDAMNNGVDYVKGGYNKAANSVKEFNANYPYTLPTAAVVAVAGASYAAYEYYAEVAE